AFLTGTAVAKAVKGHDRHALQLIVVAVILIGLVRALAMMGRRLIAGKQALGVEFDMRNALYAHLVRLSFGFYDRHQTGQLMSRRSRRKTSSASTWSSRSRRRRPSSESSKTAPKQSSRRVCAPTASARSTSR